MTCTYDQADTAPGIHLCKRCEQKLQTVLQEIPGDLEDADIAISRQSSSSDASAGKTGSKPSMPLNLEAADRKRALWEEVVSTAFWVFEADTRTETKPQTTDPAKYLAGSIGVIRLMEEAGDILRDLSRLRGRLLAVTDHQGVPLDYGDCKVPLDPKDSAPILEGDVPEGAYPCGGRIVGSDSDKWARCQKCRCRYDGEALRRLRSQKVERAGWGFHAPLPVVVRAAQQAEAVKVTLRTAQRWAKDGDLPSVRYDGKTPLYTMGALKRTAAEMQTRRGGDRSKLRECNSSGV